MEEKKGNGLLIGLLVLLIIGLIGFITYDKLIASKENEKEIDNLKQQVNTLTEEKNNLINNQSQEEAKTNNFINSVYYGAKEDAANNNYPKQILALFNDGTFLNLFVDADGSKGTYEIKENKLILHRSNDSELYEPGDSTYEFNQDKSQIKTDDGITLQKQ